MLDSITITSLVSSLIFGNKFSHCRLCLQQLDQHLSEDQVTYKRLDDTTPLPNQLYLADIIAHIGLKLPDKVNGLEAICAECIQKSVECYNFLNQCQQSQEKLSNILDNLMYSFNSINDSHLKNLQQIRVRPNLSGKDISLGDLEYVKIELDSRNKVAQNKKQSKTSDKSSELAISNKNSTTKWQRYQSSSSDDVASKKTLRKRRKSMEKVSTEEGKETTEKRDRRIIPGPKLIMKVNIKKDNNDIEQQWYICQWCQNEFTEQDFAKHCSDVHKVYPCMQCLNTYQLPWQLRKHMIQSHKAVIAPLKPRTTNYAISKGNLYICKHCGKNLNSYGVLVRHEKRHNFHGTPCPTCGKRFMTKRFFMTHKQLCEKGELPRYKEDYNKKYVCETCNKSYTHKHSLTHHIQTEHIEARYMCEYCDKKFPFPSVLKEHLITHTGEKNHECPTCKQRFATSRTLLYHIRRHTGEKPYTCKHCDEKFVNASDRNQHIILKHEMCKYMCKICDAKLCFKSMRRHLRKHDVVGKPSKMFVKIDVMF